MYTHLIPKLIGSRINRACTPEAPISPLSIINNQKLLIIGLKSPDSFENKKFEIFKVLLDDLCVHGSYVLGKIGRRKEFIPFVERDWLDYFDRNLSQTKINEKELAYEHLMKYGLSRNYWNEYVFLSYRNHRPDMILLEGFPDIPSSLPHYSEE